MENEPKRIYKPYILEYDGEVYQITPENTLVVFNENNPDFSYAAVFDPESKELIRTPIFNEYVIQWLTGDLKTYDRHNIQSLYGWTIEPVMQEAIDSLDIDMACCALRKELGRLVLGES